MTDPGDLPEHGERRGRRRPGGVHRRRIALILRIVGAVVGSLTGLVVA